MFIIIESFLQDIEIKFFDCDIDNKYNKNEFCATDGKLVEVCDKLSAYIEASLALRYGIHSEMLKESKMRLYNKFANKKIANINFLINLIICFNLMLLNLENNLKIGVVVLNYILNMTPYNALVDTLFTLTIFP